MLLFACVHQVLDGDVVRTHLSKGLGFSVADRNANVARIGWVAAEVTRQRGLAVAVPIAPFEESREAARQLVGKTCECGWWILYCV